MATTANYADQLVSNRPFNIAATSMLCCGLYKSCWQHFSCSQEE